jgi:AcrR family transcriptional regulator
VPGRPRTASDDEILAGTGRAIGRIGPSRLTLADVAAEVGLAPATLVQRFGSKRGLLLAFSARGAPVVHEAFAAARAAYSSPLAALRAALVGMTHGVATPAELANHLALLQIDLSDPDFHRHALDQARAVRDEIRALLDVAVTTGELAACDTARLARAVQATYNGALVTWAIFREGTVADWLDEDLAWLLRPFRSEG